MLGLFVLGLREVRGVRGVKEIGKKIASDPVLFLLLVLWLVRAVSIVQTKNLTASLSLLVFYSSMVGLYLLIKRYFDFRLYKAHILVVTMVGFFGFLEVLWALQKTAFPGVLLGGNYLRVPATFYDANHLPVYLLTILPFLLVLVWQARGIFRKLTLAGLLGLLTLLLLSTFSRSGMIGFGVAFSLFFLLLLTYRYYKKALTMVGVAGVVFLAVALTSQTDYSLFKRLGSILNPAEKSTTAHETLLRGEWELFLEHPILGVGYGGFSEAFRESDWGKAHLFVDPTGDIRLPAHSIWLETLCETGILGFTPYLSLMFLVLITVSKALRKAPNKDFRLYLAALGSGLAGILTAGIFYSYNLEFFWFYLFFVYLFSVWVLGTEREAFTDFGVKGDKGGKREEKVDWLELGLVFGLVVFTGWLVFFKLGERGLLDWDEAIYATVSKNIIKFKDPLTLRWIDSISWFEKPPLYMWLSSFMIYFYGVTAFAARFWSAFFGVLGVVATYFLGKALFKRKLTAFLAAVMLATTTVYLYYSRNGMLDVTFTALTTLAFYFYLVGREKKSKLLTFLSGAGFGLACLTKGFVVVVPLGVVFLYEVFSYLGVKGGRRVKWGGLLLGFLLVAGPWHIVMFLKHGREFFDSYFIYHVFKRGTEAIEGKSAPLLWYLTVIKVGFRIWAIPLLAAVPFVFYKGYKKSKEYLFLLLWAGIVFLFFSWAKSKLVWYIIPIYPALALINAGFLVWLVELCSRRLLKPLKLLTSFTAIGVILVGVGYLYFERARVFPPDFTREEVALIQIRDQLDRRNNILFLLPGFASPVPRYYNEGPVREVTSEELPELLHSEERLHFLATFSDYEELKKSLAKDNISLKLIGSVPGEADLVLVEKNGQDD
ncbi:MAG: O-antigen ligase family protein [bacterium]